jgi:hypothetical protein
MFNLHATTGEGRQGGVRGAGQVAWRAKTTGPLAQLLNLPITTEDTTNDLSTPHSSGGGRSALLLPPPQTWVGIGFGGVGGGGVTGFATL